MFLEGLPVHHALAMGDYTYLGRWARYILCAGLPVIVVLSAPFGSLDPCDVVASVVFAFFVFVLTFLVVTSLFTR